MNAAIDIARAARLYALLHSWRAVADSMPRPDGSRYQPDALCRAVRRADRAPDAQGHDNLRGRHGDTAERRADIR